MDRDYVLPACAANFDTNEIIALDRDAHGNVREFDRQILNFNEELRKSEKGGGTGQEELAHQLRVSPGIGEKAAHKHVTEFKEILKTLKR